MGRAAQIDFDTLEKEKKGAQIVCRRVLGVQKLILPLLGAKTKVKKLGGGAIWAMSKGEVFFL